MATRLETTERYLLDDEGSTVSLDIAGKEVDSIWLTIGEDLQFDTREGLRSFAENLLEAVNDIDRRYPEERDADV